MIEFLLKHTKKGKAMIKKLNTFLQGKKTYIVAIGAIIQAIIEYTTTQDLSVLINKILLALGAMTMRAGVEKSK